MALLSDRFGRDLSAYDLDGPLPDDLGTNDAYHSFSSVMLAKARREGMRLHAFPDLPA